MIVQINRIFLLLGIFFLPIESVFSQSHVSKNNYTGQRLQAGARHGRPPRLIFLDTILQLMVILL
jgi:hypothetical protein